jgi:superoxide dismutase, Fe-Mn family
MFGPGFVWLVKTTDDLKYRILTTYIAGSPYPGAHYRRQALDMSTQPASSNLSPMEYARQNTVQNTVGAFGGTGTATTAVAKGGVLLTPLLCVNTWEHVWLRDWGVGGKKGFLEAWWDRIDWNVVANHADVTATRSVPKKR